LRPTDPLQRRLLIKIERTTCAELYPTLPFAKRPARATEYRQSDQSRYQLVNWFERNATCLGAFVRIPPGLASVPAYGRSGLAAPRRYIALPLDFAGAESEAAN
jgi:hypothetical protein